MFVFYQKNMILNRPVGYVNERLLSFFDISKVALLIMVCYYDLVNLIVILIKSDGGNRPYEVQQPVLHGAKSYRCDKCLEDEVVRILASSCEEVFLRL